MPDWIRRFFLASLLTGTVPLLAVSALSVPALPPDRSWIRIFLIALPAASLALAVLLASTSSLWSALHALVPGPSSARADLIESERRYALAAAGANVGIWEIDLRTNRAYFSARFKEMLGFGPDEFENTWAAWESRLHPQDREAALEAIRGHLDNGLPLQVECRLRCRDDTYRWFRASGLAARDETGEPVRIAGSLLDVTEHRTAREELLRSNEELEQFAYVASHDLQEPIRTVTSYVQLLARKFKGQLGEEADDYIGFITEGAERMRQLIQGLLAYARVGNRDQVMAPVDLNEALRGAIDNLQAAVDEIGGAEITSDPLPTIQGNHAQIMQLFQNLLANSIKFHGTEFLRVHVSAKSQGELWRIAVRDNGIGIDPRQQDRVFLIFQRLHSREVYPGTGIGLAVCKRIVTRHGGAIWVDSHPNQGATFVFTLRGAQS